MSFKDCAAYCAALLILSNEAAAQTAPPPVSFERRAFEPPLAPRAAPEPARPDAVPVTPGASAGAFILEDVILEGAETLPRDALDDLWAPLLGQPVSVNDLEAVAAAISARYRARGFILSQAVLPEQTVEAGVVRLRVIEGFLDDTVVSGGDSSDVIAARRFLAAARQERPLRLETFERGVILTRDTLGPDIETVIEPSPDTFGAARATVLVPEDKQIDRFVAFDNRSSRLYGAWTLSGGVTAYNLAGFTERIELLGAVAPNDDYLAFLGGKVSVPPEIFDGGWFDGTRFELGADYTRGDPDLERSGASGFDSLDAETNFSAALITPFIRTRAQNLFGSLRITRRYSENQVKFNGFGIDDFSDILYVAEARLTWDRADALGGVTLVDIGLRQGLDIADADVDGDPDARGAPDFTAADVTLIRLQRFGDTPFSGFAMVTGQIADETLPSSERFGLGGDALGRGFAPGNTTGDSGYGGRLELRYDAPVARLGAGLAGAQVYAFGDWGQARDSEKTRDGDRWETLASAGAGVRIDITDRFTLTPEVAVQLNGTPVDRARDERETRFMIGGVLRF